MLIPREITVETAQAWVSNIFCPLTVTAEGEENTYYQDEFGNEYYCKNREHVSSW